jgi:O-antigen/teichoic acid export membrane protein
MTDNLEESLGTVATGGSILIIGIIIGIVFGILTQILLGRYLGVESYGLYYLALTLVTAFVPFSTIGLAGSLPRFLPYHFSRDEKDIVKSAIRFSELFVLILSVSFGIIIYVFAEKISVDFFHNSDLTIILKYFAIGLPLFSLSNVFEGVVRAFKGAKYKVAIFDIEIWVVRIIIFVVFLLIGYTMFGAIISLLVALFFTIFSSVYVLRNRFFPDYSKYKIVPVVKNLLIFSWPITFTSIILLFISKIDVILLGYFFNSIEVGIYVPALIIASYVTMLATPFSYMFLPVVTELFGKKKFVVIESLFQSTLKWIILMVLPVFIYIILFPEEVITLLYGVDYSEGYLALTILAAGITINVIAGMTGGILVGVGQTKLNLLLEIIAAIIFVSFDLVLIPIYGVIGAAIGFFACCFARTIISLFLVYKTTKIYAFNRSYYKIIFSGLITLFIGFILKTNIFPLFVSTITLFFIALFIMGLYFVLIWISRCLDKNDLLILKLIIKKVRTTIRI